MTKKIGSIAAGLAVAVSLAACSATDDNALGEQVSAELAGLDIPYVVVIVSAPVEPAWYTDRVESRQPGEFLAGGCGDALDYYPLHPQDESRGSYGYFAPVALEDVGEGILVTMGDEFVENGIEIHGLILEFGATTEKVFPTEWATEYYFIPDAELGIAPETTKQRLTEIGLCARHKLE